MFQKSTVVQRTSNQIVYDEAANMIIRGALFSAPQSLCTKYAPAVSPLSLGNNGVSDYHLPEINPDEIALFDKFVEALKALPVPDRGEVTQKTATNYVNNVLAESKVYLAQFEYFADDLGTIMGNIRTREVILTPPEVMAEVKSLVQNNDSLEETELESLMKAEKFAQIKEAFRNLNSNKEEIFSIDDFIPEGNEDDLKDFLGNDSPTGKNTPESSSSGSNSPRNH